MVKKCDFGGACNETENLVRRRHIPTDRVGYYCRDHAPDADGETWVVP